ncbi:super-infection exclusion protein B [Oceanobacillus indicireducens]|uniref:Superinfection exclusion protein B n=1 Tax=Oceanobacillus indicireducens TaxID=1004261 RepID=A0A917XV44_9BACI|nr:super-infection exclusion protein B [Oceanobacillus indicireducens]GGN54923.1 hypothetical protein GCM10007971_13200 [Oceanobacillus indicireducens]
MASGIKFDLIEFLKLAPKYFLPLLLFSGFVIFIPSSWLGYLSLDELVNKYRWIFSLVFLLSLSLILSGTAIGIGGRLKRARGKRNVKKNVKAKLENLSERQKSILRELAFGDRNTISLPVNDGEVRELELYKIIYRSSSLSTMHVYFDYNLQPLALEIINKNKNILD